jgi:hypothetical protein
LSSRDNAKEMMMELCFSGHQYYSPYKIKLKKLFPTIVTYISEHKKHAVKMYGKEAQNQFAIWLQKTEAAIFIDGVYDSLKNQGLWCLTKHDSLIVKRGHAEHIQQSVQNYFHEIGFTCCLRIK